MESHFAVAMGDSSSVEQALSSLKDELDQGSPEEAELCHRRLLPLLAERKGALAAVLFRFLESEAQCRADRCELLAGMLHARDPDLRRKTLDLVLKLAAENRMTPDLPLILSIARLVESDESFRTEQALDGIGSLLRMLPPSGRQPQEADRMEALFLAEAPSVLRRLAAHILDRSQATVPEARVRRLLGPDAASFLLPYLEYTRATHEDLVDLTPDPRAPMPALPSLRDAERVLGRSLLATVIAELGWSRLVWGLSVQHLVALSFDNSFPFVMRPLEAQLLEDACPSKRIWERFLVVAHGGAGDDPEEISSNETVQRFRHYNVAHAEVLTELLEVAPLTPERVRRLLERMDRIVDDFQALFRNETEDVSRLPAIYGDLRSKALAFLKDRAAEESLSGDATRLVQMFEDPANLEEVRTLHGLKRYLHQAGLRLAFRLFRSGCATNRSVDLLIASFRGIHTTVRQIRYLDFEPQQERGSTRLPMVVQLAVEGFARQLLHGRQSFPKLELLIYGNEVQVYAAFRNHPAFIRLDISPPIRGGMIDLEYFAVSQYEMDHHPDLSLQAIQRVLRRLEFHVRKDGFRLRARYDRERAFDFGDISEKTGMLFCLIPYLMDLDWIIGGLDYPETARPRVAGAWSDFFAFWGVFPILDVVAAERNRILRARIPTPAGEQEVFWNGQEPYTDILAGTPRPNLFEVLWNQLHAHGLLSLRETAASRGAHPSQLVLERELLQPLREALLRGEVLESEKGLVAAPASLFAREHEAERFARVLTGGGRDLIEAARMGALASSIERQVQFQTSGSVQGYPVQRAKLHLRGESVGLFVLRGPEGQIALALATLDEVLCRSRKQESDAWTNQGELQEQELALRLRKDNYVGGGYQPMTSIDVQALRYPAIFRNPSPRATPHALPGERILPGVTAAPGRTTGQVRFGDERRRPADFEGAIYASPSIRPEDAPYIVRSLGVLTTGGGTLSHAGLVALELQKPALIIAGNWVRESGAPAVLRYRLPMYQESESQIDGYAVLCRNESAEREETLSEGDIVVLHADESTLTVLGQDPEILACYQGMRQAGSALEQRDGARDERDTLEARGRLVHAMHQLERTLQRTRNPVLARHAVQELLTTRDQPQGLRAAGAASRGRLLQVLFGNPACRAVALETANRWVSQLAERHDAACTNALAVIPGLFNLYELLFLRLKILRQRALLTETASLLHGSDVQNLPHWTDTDLDVPVLQRLTELRESLRNRIQSVTREQPGRQWQLPHLQHQDSLISQVLCGTGMPALPRAKTPEAAANRNILTVEDGGRELAACIGRKGANLAEIARILGSACVPPWFALTDHAFKSALASQPGKALAELGLHDAPAHTLANGIEWILGQTSDAARKAASIRHLWLNAPLPKDLETEVLQAYHALGSSLPVAVRSSALEEDTEESAFPGQFDTFLYLQGDQAVLDHVKLAWAGLWNERAIQMRTMLKRGVTTPGGGLIIQKMVPARLSGVVHTVSLATEDLTEMTINAGLGLGEGVVSGIVDVDCIQVKKPPGPELQFRYRVGDKREQVVPDVTSGHGTRLVESQYHQRLRPALEYTELCDLAKVASALESAYGEPLDIEFAWEGQTLYILQARPIVVFHAALRDTFSDYPLKNHTRKENQP